MLLSRNTEKCCLKRWRERRGSVTALRVGAPFLLTIVLLAACSEAKQAEKPAPPEVGVVTVKAESTPLRSDLPGRTVNAATSEVRPQVTGIIRSVTFREGALVRQGQVLYQIEDAPFRAAVNQAAAALASSEALVVSTKNRATRFAQLAKDGAVAKQDSDDAQAAYGQAVASVGQTRAALQAAQVNLDFTQIRAPLTGRIGRTFATQGALVTAGQATALAAIQQLDPMRVDVTQSSADVLRLTRALSTGGAVASQAPVTLTLPDGSEYNQQGVLQFTEQVVDPATGTVTVRATFPNPESILLPGMYVQAHVTEATDPNAIQVPQQGVSRNPRGEAIALVVGSDNKVEQRILQTQQTIGDKWIVTGGLSPGERVIVEGLQRAQPGAVVNPVEAGPSAADATPSPSPPKGGG